MQSVKVERDTWKRLTDLKNENWFSNTDQTIRMLLEISTGERIKEWWTIKEPKMRKEYEQDMLELGLTSNASLQEIARAERNLHRRKDDSK